MPCTCEYPFTTNCALYISISLLMVCFILKTHLQPMILMLSGHLTMFHILTSSRLFNPFEIASSHFAQSSHAHTSSIIDRLSLSAAVMPATSMYTMSSLSGHTSASVPPSNASVNVAVAFLSNHMPPPCLLAVPSPSQSCL